MKNLFDPEGRIGPDAFLGSAMILIAIGAVFSLLPLVMGSLWLSFISLVLLYPWTVIWVKRFHDAGKSGWMFLLVFVLWLAVSFGASHFISGQFAPEPVVQPTDFSSAMAMASERAQAIAIPGTIVSAIISILFVLGGNALLKSDPGPNAYDPPPHLR